jgi:hypothetical protein
VKGKLASTTRSCHISRHTAYIALVSEGAPAPEGVAIGSSLVDSMEVQVGSPFPQVDDVVATSSILPIESE